MAQARLPHDRKDRKDRRPRKPANPLIKGILAFCQKAGISVVDADADADADAPNEVEEQHTNDAGDVRLYHDATATDTGTGTATESLVGGRTLKLSPSDLPKRHTVYPPLLLLPHKFPTHSARWTAVYGALSEDDRAELFRCIAEEGFVGGTSSRRISRIAINAPISAEEEEGEGEGEGAAAADVSEVEVEVEVSTSSPLRKGKEKNILRSPSGLVPVYGDWGTGITGSSRGGSGGSGSGSGGRRTKTTSSDQHPTRLDFEEAFWTSTAQHRGITQCWAPLYTMFSRGNVSEKARILGLCHGGPGPGPQVPVRGKKDVMGTGMGMGMGMGVEDVTASSSSPEGFPGLTVNELGEPVEAIDVVDFYVGIGYFAFCYLARGVRRVWGWDINPWSIEGLRRGCERNGWGCVVVKVDGQGNLVGKESVADVVCRIQEGDVVGARGKMLAHRGGPEDEEEVEEEEGQRQREVIKCIAFLGDNKWADKVMREFQEAGMEFNVRHANLGLLPTSRGGWDNAVKAIVGLSGSGSGSGSGGGKGGWMHVHENVDVREIDDMARQTVRDIQGVVSVQEVESPSREAWSVSSVHVQQVKTYAPGVMHCVYDIQIKPPNG
ncbi:S-adenosylmethionine-dependent methyltransferase [Exophiala xenobiotica]|nr:S-adenosylmethionine-dependent methyltransferase [Exophiala xenobiotica]